MSIEEEIHRRFRNPYHKGLNNLIYASKQVSSEFIQSLKKHDMTDQQYNVLHVLRGYRDKGLQNIGFIKEHMLDKQSEMSRIIDRLYEKELVSRKENLEDHRQKSVEITEKEMKLLDEMYDCEKASDNFLSKLSPEEVDELKRLLDKIRN